MSTPGGVVHSRMFVRMHAVAELIYGPVRSLSICFVLQGEPQDNNSIRQVSVRSFLPVVPLSL